MYQGKVVESGPVETDLPRAAGRLHADADRLGAEARGEGRRSAASVRRSPPMQPPVIEVRNLENALRPRRQRRQGGRRRVAQGASRARRSASSASAARARPRSAAACCASYDPTAGRIDYRRPDGSVIDLATADKPTLQDLPARDPHDLPGPVLLAQSAHDGGADHRRAAAGQRHRQGRGARRPRRRAAAPGRPRARLARALSARLLRRPAPAHRHRPRASRSTRGSSSPTRRPRRSTCRCARRCSTCCSSCRTSSTSPTSSSATTSA